MIRKKALGSFSFDVAKRVLYVLSEYGTSIKKTNLASKAGLNYNVCLRYIRLLNILGWIEVNSDIKITKAGKAAFAKLFDASKARDSNAGGDVWPSNMRESGIKYFWPSHISSLTTQKKPASSSIEERQTVSEDKQETGNKNKPIMIVDDEEDVAQTYEYFLSSAGYEARTFIDPFSALHEYVSDPFLYNLLVLDIRIQGINGLQLYQSMKAINPECKAIFVTALDAAGEVVSVLPGTKPHDIIRKPVSREQFVTAVKVALSQS